MEKNKIQNKQSKLHYQKELKKKIGENKNQLLEDSERK
jgi:hypothetical protein